SQESILISAGVFLRDQMERCRVRSLYGSQPHVFSGPSLPPKRTRGYVSTACGQSISILTVPNCARIRSKTLSSNGALIGSRANVQILIEGHADERGSTEYNLALGDNRANTVRELLIQAGVSASHLSVVSFGKEKPFCTESTESCWQENRRA